MLRETQSLELGLSEVLLLDMSEAWANTNQSACLGPARWSWVSSQHSSLRMVWFLPWKLRANIERPWKIRSNSTWHELYLGVYAVLTILSMRRARQVWSSVHDHIAPCYQNQLERYQSHLYLSICWTLGRVWLNELDLRMTFLVKEETNECRPWVLSLAFKSPGPAPALNGCPVCVFIGRLHLMSLFCSCTPMMGHNFCEYYKCNMQKSYLLHLSIFISYICSI